MNTIVFNEHEAAYGIVGFYNTIERMFSVNSCKVHARVCYLCKSGKLSSKYKPCEVVTHHFGELKSVRVYGTGTLARYVASLAGELNRLGLINSYTWEQENDENVYGWVEY